ncbi:MAG: DUF4160 domain-containing protein [Candidatus Limnocylindrales bacterium]|nr:DUF4160 domain-containing protein [Candidatus Limnocylindrales bacterium]
MGFIFSGTAHLALTEISGGEATPRMITPRRSFGEVRVPTVHRFGPYRFYFWSHENRQTGEPPHIHVVSGDGEASFWLSPVAVRDAWDYTPREIERIRRLVVVHREEILRRWHEFFGE